MSVGGVGVSIGVSLLVLLGAAGCQTRAVAPEPGPTATKQAYTTVVIGDIAPLYPEWKRLVRFYKEGLAQKLRESGAFDSVLYPMPVNPPADAVLVRGVLDGVDEGSELTRILLAISASRATVQGQFRLVDGSGATLAEFRQERVSDGSSVHDEQIYMEDLAGELGRDTAGTVIRWSRGQDLAPDRSVADWWSDMIGMFD